MMCGCAGRMCALVRRRMCTFVRGRFCAYRSCGTARVCWWRMKDVKKKKAEALFCVDDHLFCCWVPRTCSRSGLAVQVSTKTESTKLSALSIVFRREEHTLWNLN